MTKETILPEALMEIQRNKYISGKNLVALADLYKERFWRAIQAVAEQRVKRYVFQPSQRVRWIVVGRERDYLILPEHYCSCQDFYIKVVIHRQIRFCYHLISMLIAEALGLYSDIKVEDERYFDLMQSWKLDMISNSAGDKV
ncbi:MAG: hypothetical protein ACTSVM_03380 [Candidatus Ranarchaeia archaeon]